MELPDDTLLGDARQALREEVEKGAICPCCTQLAKVYRRHMTSVTGRAMICMWRESGTGWVHVPTLMKEQLPGIAHQGGYATLAHYWGLIEEAGEKREDGGRAGWWRLTTKGAQFVQNEITVHQYTRTYDSRVLSELGEMVTIVNVLGKKFDYNELMGR